MKPDFAKSILNPAWVYRNSAQTSVAETFKRIRQEMEAAKVDQTIIWEPHVVIANACGASVSLPIDGARKVRKIK